MARFRTLRRFPALYSCHLTNSQRLAPRAKGYFSLRRWRKQRTEPECVAQDVLGSRIRPALPGRTGIPLRQMVLYSGESVWSGKFRLRCEVDTHLQWAAYSVSPSGLGCDQGDSKVKSQPNWGIPSQVCPANLLERPLCTEGIGQMLRETGAHTPEGGGESWQDHVQA